MKRSNPAEEEKNVLVAVIKTKDDMRRLLREHWYRIPAAAMPKRPFSYIAFYQPAAFGTRGKRIECYAKISSRKAMKRIELLPDEPRHPNAGEEYVRFAFRHVKTLPQPIRNVIPRRVSFGFVSLNSLLAAKDILELYHVSPTERILETVLENRGMEIVTEHTVSEKSHRYRIDLAIFCREGKIAIECDNDKAHASKEQKEWDLGKDIFLAEHGWRTLRFKEQEIVNETESCAELVEKIARNLGGQKNN